jgi:RNA polymerase sigma-70 factor (ECF subfamily)
VDTLEARPAADGVEALERRDQIQVALEALTEEYREVVVLRHFADLSYAEISEVVGVPEKTVRSRLFSARQRLGALLANGERQR